MAKVEPRGFFPLATYSYARLSEVDLGFLRIGGAGLGNLLVTWAEFVTGTARYGLIPIAPTWPQFKLGPLVRNESDKRFYRDLFVRAPGEVSGIKKLKLLSRLPRIPAAEFANSFVPRPSVNSREVLVEFANAGSLFENILKDHAFIRSELLKITREEHKSGLQHDFHRSISVHVRLGDFRVESLRTSAEWYTATIAAIRRAVGSDLPVYVFSDGENKELKPILNLPATTRLAFGSSLADMWALSAADILVASGGSTFSKWASYLGRMPVVYPPGTLYHRLYYENQAAEVKWSEGETFSSAFVEQLKCRLTAA